MKTIRSTIPRSNLAMRWLRLHLLATTVARETFLGTTCVVIDALRATTTIAQAVAAGAREVRVFEEVEPARRAALTLERAEYVLAGERGGKRIEGFDLGNSPAEFVPERVGGRTILFTTTNGTRALARCGLAGEVLVAAAVNLESAAAALAGATSVDLVCAGTDGEVSREDVLVAGGLVARLLADSGWEPTDEALLARDAWQAVVGTAVGALRQNLLARAMAESRGGRNLLALGLGEDIRWSAGVNSLAVVPKYDGATGVVTK
jgi:2-phosphosulfolactate phosphatase